MPRSALRRIAFPAFLAIVSPVTLLADQPDLVPGDSSGPVELSVNILAEESIDHELTGEEESQESDGASVVHSILEEIEPEEDSKSDSKSEPDSEIHPVLFQLDVTTPMLPTQRPLETPVGLSPAAREFADTILAARTTRSNLLSPQRRRYARSNSDVVFGSEARFRVATDTGSLLGKTNSAPGVRTKKRSPIITETRVHGSNPGQLLASGSYWFPARQDVDTALDKIDSRIIQDVIITKGPFAARYGPGFDFIDFQLLPAPRYQNGYEAHGSTVAEYKTNGEQWYGRQSAWGGSHDYGYRIGYGIRTGSDYKDGAGNPVLSSYKSQDVDFAYGYDFGPDRHLEVNYIWLEMNDVEVPTQLLDIRHLRTHGVESSYVVENGDLFDVWTLETWYNTTSMSGDGNSPAKRQAIPFLGQNVRSIQYNAKNMSAGFSLFGDVLTDDSVTTYGADLRWLTQEVNHLADVVGLTTPFLFGNNATPAVNGPVPPSYTANPGFFIERNRDLTDRFRIASGARGDIVQMNGDTIVDEVGGFSGPLGLVGPNGEFPFVYNPNGDPILLPPPTGLVPGVPAELDDLLLGSFNRAFGLGSAYIDGEYDLNRCWTATCGFGFGMRAPTMTELYALQHVSTVLPQQTFSVLFGNPNLKAERRYQVNAGLGVDRGWYRARVNAFHAWIENYITLDAFDPNFYIYQYTNTDLATLTGFDFYSEMSLTQRMTGFLTATYTDGRDRTRESNPQPSGLDGPGGPTRSGVVGLPAEALPNISPLEARLGFLIDDGTPQSRWVMEFSARFVDNQDRIALTLGELPTPGFTVLDFRSFWQATDHLRINTGVENFGDRLYREHLDPAGRILPVNPFAPGTETSLGTVFRPGANFYLSSELTY